jgi:hypothetical protein
MFAEPEAEEFPVFERSCVLAELPKPANAASKSSFAVPVRSGALRAKGSAAACSLSVLPPVGVATIPEFKSPGKAPGMVSLAAGEAFDLRSSPGDTALAVSDGPAADEPVGVVPM